MGVNDFISSIEKISGAKDLGIVFALEDSEKEIGLDNKLIIKDIRKEYVYEPDDETYEDDGFIIIKTVLYGEDLSDEICYIADMQNKTKKQVTKELVKSGKLKKKILVLFEI